jgi:heat shock protein HslJ
MKKVLVVSLIVVLAIICCKKEKQESEEQASFLNTDWELSFIQDTKTYAKTFYPADEPKKIIINFTDSSDVVLFLGICNDGDGTYSYSAETGELKIIDLGSTKIACTNVEWEGYTIQNMNQAYQYQIEGDQLIILSNGNYNLYFNKL